MTQVLVFKGESLAEFWGRTSILPVYLSRAPVRRESARPDDAAWPHGPASCNLWRRRRSDGGAR